MHNPSLEFLDQMEVDNNLIMVYSRNGQKPTLVNMAIPLISLQQLLSKQEKDYRILL